MMRLFFGYVTLELSIFNMKRQPLGFDDMEFSTLTWVEDFVFDDNHDDMFSAKYESFLNWVEDFVFDDDLNDMFAAKYESFLMNDEPEYDVLELDDLCSSPDYLLATIAEFASNPISPSTALELKPLPNSLKY